MISRLALRFISILNRIIPKAESKNIFISSPDFSDNSFALFRYMAEHYHDNKEYIWLVDKIDDLLDYENMLRRYVVAPETVMESIKIVSKKSLPGIWAFMRSKYVFFTHGFYLGVSLSKSQVRVNLWHGMPLKAIGYLNSHGNDKSIPRCNYVIATSLIFQEIMSRVFAVDKDKVLVVGQPRYDLIGEEKNCLNKFGIDKAEYKKIIFWTPTYRRSVDGKIKDGDCFSLDKNVLESINQYAAQNSIYFIIKLHPMDSLNRENFLNLSHISVLKNEDMLKESCQLVSLLNDIDILITDFSSIYIDFLLLGKPMIFFIPDFEQYMTMRGFIVDNPKEWMPGRKVKTVDGLQKAISELLENKDKYSKQRKNLRDKFHMHTNNFSKRVLEGIGFE